MVSGCEIDGERRSRSLPILMLLVSALASSAAPSLRWVSDPAQPYLAWVEVAPLENFVLPAKASERTGLLSVRVTPTSNSALPPMAGRYSLEKNMLRFHPQFPLEPGLRYTASFKSLRASITAPPRKDAPATKVSKITPTAGTLPLNLLKFYIHFSAPMTRGSSYQHIQLQDSMGERVADPFLELPEELWNPEMTRLTILLDPGRIKRGLLPNEVVGAVFEDGKDYTLRIDRSWKDASGRLLEKSSAKKFRAAAPDYRQPQPRNWQFRYPTAGTREPLRITFAEPLDAALATRLLVVGREPNLILGGTTSLAAHETVWEFRPAEPWSEKPHHLKIDHRLEDLVGNSIERPFEEALDRHPEAAGAPPPKSRHPFAPKPAAPKVE